LFEVNEAILRFGATDRRALLLRPLVLAHVRAVMRACDENRSLAAELLGIPRRTLQRWLARTRKPAAKTRRRKK
jgi:ActR/RegA family two-component response regulator